MKKKTIGMLIALVLVLTCAVGGTLAWLTDKTDTVTNAFTVGGIDITLIETEKPDGTVVETGVTDWAAQMLPGETYSKNPTVSVDRTTDVDCYLFVKFVENDAAKTYLDYTSMLTKEGSGWVLVPDETDIWYRVVRTKDADKSWNLLENDEVTVNAEAVTEKTMDAAKEATLSYTAYAVQLSNGDTEFTPKDAWAVMEAELNK